MSASSQSGFKNQIMFSSLSPSSVFRELFPSPPKSVGVKVREVTPAGGKVPKIVFDFSNLPEGESDRRKKLLNSIDKVEEQVLQQLEILKNTASAKEAERANRNKLWMRSLVQRVTDEYSQGVRENEKYKGIKFIG
ncbi:protein POLYCHOME-like isoform X1 [Phaseolus vulgaris]|uniref:Uncharacterized protein n=1 Tax=Phaseolus vulgaris TaxID=3885 RepID=V7B8X2_PHAVU|nr:hypothetical protein PHAVU_008G153400g [Phaseolus vulgaris]ESW12926.1 hypothetical protein PHAVU_008G153400g [Phaseolus vulgaris]